MFRKVLKIVGWILLALLLVLAVQLARNWETVQRVLLGGLHVYETTPPTLPPDIKRPAILVFSKTNAFRHEEAIPAGNTFFAQVAIDKGWGYFQTENGAVFTPDLLKQFDAVVFNNVSGDVLTAGQQAAFKAFLESGGGYVGLHAAGDSSHKDWAWYTAEIIGANFTQHTMAPQFQEALVKLEAAAHPAMQGLPAQWKRTEEWYSFDKSPRGPRFDILATVDENSYKPVGMFSKDLRMGDHPVAWSRCLGKGRTFYTIIGHRAETFSEAESKTMLTNALGWTTRQTGSECDAAPATEAAQ